MLQNMCKDKDKGDGNGNGNLYVISDLYIDSCQQILFFPPFFIF